MRHQIQNNNLLFVELWEGGFENHGQIACVLLNAIRGAECSRSHVVTLPLQKLLNALIHTNQKNLRPVVLRFCRRYCCGEFRWLQWCCLLCFLPKHLSIVTAASIPSVSPET